MERVTSLTEGKINYEMTEGSSVDVILLHGFPFNHHMWGPQIEALGKIYRVMAPDFRSHGKSIFKSYPWTISHLVDDIKELMEKNFSKRAIICGLSMGGYVALEFASKYPELLAGLVLCDTKAPGDDNKGKEARIKTMTKISLLGKENFASEFSAKCVHHNPIAQKKIHDMIMECQDSDIISGLLSLAARKDHSETLSKITCPTLVICGEKDEITPVIDSEFIHKNIRDSKLEIIPNAGHVSNLDGPDNFNLQLTKFLNYFNI